MSSQPVDPAQRFAFDEVRDLNRNLPDDADVEHPVVRYLCAIFSELAYYHIPDWEFDQARRAKIVMPSDAYQALIGRSGGIPRDVNNVFAQAEISGFVAVDRGVVAVGARLGNRVFVGFRGTKFLFDWRINLRAKLVTVPFLSYYSGNYYAASYHVGMAEEAARISPRIRDAICKLVPDDNSVRYFLAGHSLGGAVAAISGKFLRLPGGTCTLGAPRYTDISGFTAYRQRSAVVRRAGDTLPTVPPRWMGYIDTPNAIFPDGRQYLDLEGFGTTLHDLANWVRFLRGRGSRHSIEAYRNEIGRAAQVAGATLPLVRFSKLVSRDFQHIAEGAMEFVSPSAF